MHAGTPPGSTPDAAVGPGSSPLPDASAPPDSAASETGPARGSLVRLADWSPDAPSSGFDVCLALHGTNAWTRPLLAANGVAAPAFPQVSVYLAHPTGDYDALIVPGGSGGCGSPVHPSTTLPAFLADQHATIAVVGDGAVIDNDAPLEVNVFLDETTAPAGQAALRFVDAVPSLSAVQLGSGSVAAGDFEPWFGDVAFGTAAANQVDGGTADVDGYVFLAPLTTAVSAQGPGGSPADVATASSVSLSAGTAMTLALVNGKNGGPPPQFLACRDDRAAAGAATPCALLSP